VSKREVAALRSGPKVRTQGRRSHLQPARATVPLDEVVCRAFLGFVLLTLRAGYSRTDLARLNRLLFAALPRVVRSRARPLPDGFEDIAHVVTLWHSLKEYLRGGRPRRLPLRGPAPSIEALVIRVNPTLDPNTVTKHLLETGTVKKVARQYTPVRRWLRYRNTPFHAAHQLRRTLGLLTTQDHNAAQARPRGRFEQAADSPVFPVSALPALKRFVTDRLQPVLEELDAFMDRRAQARRPGEPTLRVAIGTYLFQSGAEGQTAEFNAVLDEICKRLKIGAPTGRRLGTPEQRS
jgi:hypothetical protein